MFVEKSYYSQQIHWKYCISRPNICKRICRSKPRISRFHQCRDSAKPLVFDFSINNGPKSNKSYVSNPMVFVFNDFRVSYPSIFSLKVHSITRYSDSLSAACVISSITYLDDRCSLSRVKTQSKIVSLCFCRY